MVAASDIQCRPSDFAGLGFATACQYIRNRSEVCDGGGYLRWTEIAFCMPSELLRVFVLLASLVFFVFLFIHLSTTGDSFFCKNIAAIVDLHRISQNIAGITFMAFGNGAPDIFTSIASVISAKQPRSELAISGLLGGGIFVTTCIISAIVLIRPFQLMRRPVLRDLCFYLIALSLLVFITFGGGQMHIWQPVAFLLLYVIYAIFVVSGNILRQRMRNAKRRQRMSKTISRFSGLVPPKRCKVKPLDIDEVQKEQKQKHENHNWSGRFIVTPSADEKGDGRISSVVELPDGTLVIPIRLHHRIGQPADEQEFRANDYLEAGKFFAKEELDELNTTDDSSRREEEGGGETPSTTVTVMTLAKSDRSGTPILGRTQSKWGNEWRKLGEALAPMDWHKFHRRSLIHRLFLIAKMPSMLLLRSTIPCASRPWSKPASTIHAFLAPLVFCFAFQCSPRTSIGNSPFILLELALVVSLVFALLVILFTRLDTEPSCYRRCAAYIGFCLSIAWIYATASEVMNVVIMFGVLSGISFQILGVTAIAWSNSIGDFVADISVARQGMQRMAFSAAIGAPLFNLMVGFGTTFTIAELQGKVVTIRADPILATMFLFLGLSLLSNLLLLLLQKFFVRRFHSFLLFFLYALFLTFAILASQRTFSA